MFVGENWPCCFDVLFLCLEKFYFVIFFFCFHMFMYNLKNCLYYLSSLAKSYLEAFSSTLQRRCVTQKVCRVQRRAVL